MDDFGHPYFSSPGLYLSKKITETFGLRARYESPGTIQRSMMSCLSSADAEEADMAGRAAVRYAIEGESSVMVALERESGRENICSQNGPFNQLLREQLLAFKGLSTAERAVACSQADHPNVVTCHGLLSA